MKTIYSTIALIVLIYFSQNILAQDSKVIYRDDNLSGKLEMLKSDFIKGGAYIWNINVPKGFPVKISRTNNLYIDNVEIYVDDKLNDILTYHHGATEYSDIIYSSGGKITVKMKPLDYTIQTEKNIIATIKFARLNQENSETTVLKGDLELEAGIIRAYGKQDFLGSKVSAILGKDYESYTLFGGVNGGRIRGSQEGYLILEANPSGYGTTPTVYINRFVSNSNIIMTSASGKVGIGVDKPMVKLHLGGAIRGHKDGGALEVNTENGYLVLGAKDKTGTHFQTDLPKFIFNKDIETAGNLIIANPNQMTPIGKLGQILYFGHSGENNDPIWMSRINIANDQLELRLNIGDDCSDKFIIGRTFYTHQENAFTPVLVVAPTEENSGKVGINVYNPQYELDVKGTIRATEVKIESLDKFADFVFEKDYNLRPISEVKQFIEEKGHLPEIPPASEVKEKGMSLIEMQVKLLQKIEELTLYVIDLTETIETQKTKINELENKIR